MVKRMPEAKMFGGKRYLIVGQHSTKTKLACEYWATFQRRNNNLNVRIVKSPYGGYEIYIRRRLVRCDL